MCGLQSIVPSSFFSGSLAVKCIPAAKGVSARAQSSGRVVASSNETQALKIWSSEIRGHSLFSSFPSPPHSPPPSVLIPRSLHRFSPPLRAQLHLHSNRVLCVPA